MKFRIFKTSDIMGNIKPCENAILENGNDKNALFKIWSIEINTIEDLKNIQTELKKENNNPTDDNELIISFYDHFNREEEIVPYIEIYDDWREYECRFV